MKILLDTNIVIDNLACRDEFGESYQLLGLCENKFVEGSITTVTVTDTMYIMHKHLTHNEAQNAMKMLLQTVDVIPVLKSDINTVLDSDYSDFENAVQSSCAARIKADYIVTRNVKDFSKSLVPAVYPADILRTILMAQPNEAL